MELSLAVENPNVSDSSDSSIIGAPYVIQIIPDVGPKNPARIPVQRSVSVLSESSLMHISETDKSCDSLKKKKKRLPMGDPSDIDLFAGPWAGFIGENVGSMKASAEEVARAIELTAQISVQTVRETNEVADLEDIFDEKEKQAKIPFITMGKEFSQFHLPSNWRRDYLGRTYMDAPFSSMTLKRYSSEEEIGSSVADFECFLPKKCIHTWSGHTKGVSSIRLFPNTGHLLLSCSMDASVKLWDVYGNDRRLLRTYYGHNKAVKDISFRPDGLKFVSASYDKTLKIWDTETGSCLGGIHTKGFPYCVVWHPSPTHSSLIMAGCSNRRIYTWDERVPTDAPVQEYTHHLEAINSICFIDGNRRFISSSDDKTLRIWDDGIPVPIKSIADPQMHSMPSIRLHPEGELFAVQSMDNQILTFSAGSNGPKEVVDPLAYYSPRDKFRQNAKKFTGHVIAGHSCQISFSPDGEYIMSGDSDGKLHFWNWKTRKPVKQMRCHEKVLIAAEWLPFEPSKVVTCSWDGTIKLWD